MKKIAPSQRKRKESDILGEKVIDQYLDFWVFFWVTILSQNRKTRGISSRYVDLR